MKISHGALAAFAFIVVGCGANLTLKYIDFDVKEQGKDVPEKKFFMDGLDGSPENKAFHQAQHGDTPGAKKSLEDGIAQNPKNKWFHYDLGILHEATGEWDKAEAEMKTAETLDPKESYFHDELKFIAAHKAK